MLTDITTINAHKRYVSGVPFSPDGRLLASGSDQDETVKLWSVGSWKEKAQLQAIGDSKGVGVRSVRFFPTGKRLLATGSGAIWFFDIGKKKLLERFWVHSFPWVTGGVVLPGENRFLSYGYDGYLRLWDIQAKHRIFQSTKFNGYGGPLDCSANGRHCAVGTNSAVSLWDLQSLKELHRLRGHKKRVRSVCFSPDGTALASGSADRTIRFWDVTSGAALGTIQTEKQQQVWCLAYFGQGTTLASATGTGLVGGKITIWDTKRLQPCADTGLHDVPIGAAISPDGRLIAAAYGHRGQIKIWAV
jgi:WD40 repeat protein